MESAESRALLIVLMVIAISVVVANRTPAMIGVGVWAQEIVVDAVLTRWVVTLIMNLNICLSELVKDGSRSLGINS